MSVATQRHGEIVVLRFDHPPVNAFDLEVAAAIERALDEALAEEPGAIILTGTGRCFSAGLNLKVVPRYDAAEQRAMLDRANRVLARLYACPVPTVAAVNGHAIAAGLVLALACDHRVGPDRGAHFGLTEVRVGIPFPAAAMAVVRAELTPAAARTLALLGRRIDAGAAEALGLIDETRAPGDVLSRALAVAADLATLPRGAYARIKQQLRGPALAEIAANARGGDPLAATWIDADAPTTARTLLKRTNDHVES
ncbi:MAG: enoyl-CoA hydratase/isomerase family protein [Deltaproteobacteria bacterium]|nr:enoyl-CoA hydratase/isomerase family protein [Deltaproteobacteria bacterium]